MAHLSVVIPVYNECSLIDELIKRVKTNIKFITEDFEIIVVRLEYVFVGSLISGLY